MSLAPKIVFVFREKTEAFPRIRGVSFVSIPLLAHSRLKVKWPKLECDDLVLTSRFALTPTQMKRVQAKRTICIGKKTAKLAKRSRRSVIAVHPENQEGLLDFFRKQKAKGRIFFPRSKLGDPAIPKALRSLGYKVRTLSTYTMRIQKRRQALLSALRKAKGRKARIIFWISSPSTLKAVFQNLKRQDLRAFPISWVAIGPTTSQALRKARLSHRVAPQPRLSAFVWK